jgi:DNA processing protein
LARFPDPTKIWRARRSDLLKAGLPPGATDWFIEQRNNARPEQELEILEREDIQVIGLHGIKKLALLGEIHDPPLLLFCRGNEQAISHEPSLAVVGTRSISRYGQAATAQICRPLARAGFTIVSGLAIGVDAAAHQAALEESGLTVAVLAGGIDRPNVHPKANARLAERIIESGGALVSELPPGCQPNRLRFPRRNRIIAGLTQGTIVVEAATKSGALITAEHAMEFNRDVWSVPGPITQRTSQGTNRLIAQGANPAWTAQAIIEYYGQTADTGAEPRNASLEENLIIDILSKQSENLDSIIKQSGLAAPIALSNLSQLEIKGIVIRQGAGFSLNVDSLP